MLGGIYVMLLEALAALGDEIGADVSVTNVFGSGVDLHASVTLTPRGPVIDITPPPKRRRKKRGLGGK
jgi:hypothetical protein